MKKQIYISDSDNHELITLMKLISAEDETTDLMLIMSDQVMKEKHFLKNLNNDIRIEVSESEYINDLLSYMWLKHFDIQIQSADDAWRMFIVNDHDSHLIKKFVDYCFESEVNIISFLLSAHSTYLLQSLDIDVFQSFKHYHQEILKNSIWFSDVDYKQTNFLASFQKIWDLIFKKITICSAFWKSDLFSFNSLTVLKRVQEFATSEWSLWSENEEDELYFEMNFNNMSMSYFSHMYDVCFSYINKKLT